MKTASDVATFVRINDSIKDGKPHLLRRGPQSVVGYWLNGGWMLGRPEHGPPISLWFTPIEYRRP